MVQHERQNKFFDEAEYKEIAIAANLIKQDLLPGASTLQPFTAFKREFGLPPARYRNEHRTASEFTAWFSPSRCLTFCTFFRYLPIFTPIQKNVGISYFAVQPITP